MNIFCLKNITQLYLCSFVRKNICRFQNIALFLSSMGLQSQKNLTFIQSNEINTGNYQFI